MANLAQDSLTLHGSESAGEAIHLHTSLEDGSTWEFQGDVEALLAATGKAVGEGTNNVCLNSVSHSGAHLVTGVFTYRSASTAQFGVVMYGTSTGNGTVGDHLRFEMLPSLDSAWLVTMVGGVGAAPSQVTIPLTLVDGTDYTLVGKIDASNVFSGTINGLDCGSIANPTALTGGHGGLFWGSGGPTGTSAVSFLMSTAMSAGTLATSSSGSGSIHFALGAPSGASGNCSYVLQRGTDGTTFATTAQTLTGQAGAASMTDSAPVGATYYYYRVLVTDAASNAAFSNVVGPTRAFATYTSLVANPQLLPSGPLATTLQGLVYFNNTLGSGRDLVHNTPPFRWAGASFLNLGGDPVWVPGAFDADATPSPMLRFGTNDAAQVWEYAGVGGSCVRAGNNLDRTFGAVFTPLAVDQFSTASQFPIVGQMLSPFAGAGSGVGQQPYEGLGVVGSTNSSLVYLCYYNNASAFPVYCCDSTGSVPQCQLTPGHEYIAFVTVKADGSYCRFFLFDATLRIEVSPQGNQFFNLFGFPVGTTENAPHAVGNTAVAGTTADMVVHGDAGITFQIKMALIDNQAWGAGSVGPAAPSGIPFSIMNSFVDNLYFPTTATINTAGTPPTTLVDGSGDTIFSASSGVSGAPANLPQVAIGDMQVVGIDESGVTVQVTPPIGAPATPTTYNFYYNLVYGSGNGTLAATGSVPVATFALPTSAQYFLTATAVAGGTTYQYKQHPATRRTRKALSIQLGGNSIYMAGRVLQILGQLCAQCQARGFDCKASTFGINSSVYSDFGPGSSRTYGFFGVGGGPAVNPFDWQLIRGSQEKGATGNNVDLQAWQLTSNSPTILTSDFTAFETNARAGTGVSGTAYGPAVSAVAFACPPWQQGGHSSASVVAALLDQVNAEAIANGTTVFAPGRTASGFAANYNYQMTGGHPDQLVAQVEAQSILVECFPAIFNPQAGGPAATSYVASGIPSAPAVGETYPVTIVLNDPASASGVITPTPASGIAWGPAVTLASGAVAGSTTVTFAAGTYTPAFTHTGLGFAGDPTLASVTASINHGPPATSYTVLGIPSAPVVGEVYAVVVALNDPCSASGVVTLGAQSGITWGGSVSIGQFGLTGSTTATFTAAGAYTPTVTHTGLGFSGDPTLSSLTASAGSGGGLSLGQLNTALASGVARIDLTQPLADVKAATVGGALHGAWATSWGKVVVDAIAKTLSIFGFNSQSTAAEVFDLDNGTSPTNRTPR